MPKASRHQAGQFPATEKSLLPSDSNKAWPGSARKDSKSELEGIYSASIAAVNFENTSSTESPVFALVRTIFQPAAVSSASRAESISHLSARSLLLNTRTAGTLPAS